MGKDILEIAGMIPETETTEVSGDSQEKLSPAELDALREESLKKQDALEAENREPEVTQEELEEALKQLHKGVVKLNNPEKVIFEGETEEKEITEIEYDFMRLTLEMFLNLKQIPYTANDLEDRLVTTYSLPSSEGMLVAFSHASKIPFAQMKKFSLLNALAINMVNRNFFITSALKLGG